MIRRKFAIYVFTWESSEEQTSPKKKYRINWQLLLIVVHTILKLTGFFPMM